MCPTGEFFCVDFISVGYCLLRRASEIKYFSLTIQENICSFQKRFLFKPASNKNLHNLILLEQLEVLKCMLFNELIDKKCL